MPDPGRKTVRVRIEGRVQGVWFRAWTREQARGRSLDGWVRNCTDGSVEALFSGPEDAVSAMLEACWNGPPAARVDNVIPKPDDEPPQPGFGMRPTA